VISHEEQDAGYMSQCPVFIDSDIENVISHEEQDAGYMSQCPVFIDSDIKYTMQRVTIMNGPYQNISIV